MGLVEEKSPIWVKHAVRRWKQFYNEIQYADGQTDTSSPLSAIFRNDAIAMKSAAASTDDESKSPESSPSKKEDSSQPHPEKSPSTKSEKKQSKGRFLFKIKELQFLPNFLSFF